MNTSQVPTTTTDRRTVSEEQLAEMLGTSVRHLRRQRAEKAKGFPAPLPGLGRRVVYSLSSIERYLGEAR